MVAGDNIIGPSYSNQATSSRNACTNRACPHIKVCPRVSTNVLALNSVGITGHGDDISMKKGKNISSDITERIDYVSNCESANTKQSKEQDKKLVVENTKVDDSSLVWSQNQQKILEWALTQYPKGTSERWEKIAEHIPGKNKVINFISNILFIPLQSILVCLSFHNLLKYYQYLAVVPLFRI